MGFDRNILKIKIIEPSYFPQAELYFVTYLKIEIFVGKLLQLLFSRNTNPKCWLSISNNQEIKVKVLFLYLPYIIHAIYEHFLKISNRLTFNFCRFFITKRTFTILNRKIYVFNDKKHILNFAHAILINIFVYITSFMLFAFYYLILFITLFNV